jgi:hypothetical protein
MDDWDLQIFISRVELTHPVIASLDHLLYRKR